MRKNLTTFVQIADGVDDETWRYHLPAESRARIAAAIRERYTAPA